MMIQDVNTLARSVPERLSVGIQSVEIGVALLKLLADAPGPMPLAKLAELAGMPRSKAHKYLASFVRCELVNQSVAGGPYDLGPLALELGLASMRRLDVIEMGQQALNALRDELATTASLAIWANRGPTIVRWAETGDIATRAVQLGTVFPVLASTLGLVFAAFLDSRMTADLIRSELAMTNGPAAWAGLKRISDVDALLTKVRRNGLATSAKSVIAPGVASIAIPVFQYEIGLLQCLQLRGVRDSWTCLSRANRHEPWQGSVAISQCGLVLDRFAERNVPPAP